MKRKKIVTVIGARPQFVKAAIVSEAIRSSGRLKEVMVHTGQHFDGNMSGVFFDELGMSPPDYNLQIGGGSHGMMMGRMLISIEDVLLSEKPDAVLVYGDTNSTLAGALAAVKLHVPIAHVESGLRSFNLDMPEEVNRIMTDRVSRWLFTPTVQGARNLKREGFPDRQIFLVGDVMYDAAIRFGSNGAAGEALLELIGVRSRGYLLVTVHRAENTDDHDRLSAVVDAVIKVAGRIPVLWPLHPRTKALLQKNPRAGELARQVRLVDPMGYLSMVQLEKHAAVIATDSGGVQKEAFFHRIPCVTLRDETEWTELVESGWNRLVPVKHPDQVAASILEAIGSRGLDVSPYGNGDAAKKIVFVLEKDVAA